MNKAETVDVFLHGSQVGQLALTPDHLCAFEYDPVFLRKGFSVSPFWLPLKPGVFISKRDPFNGLFGVFNDSLPDGWGMLLKIPAWR
jgi:serine/threonine-protein kinase HipA